MAGLTAIRIQDPNSAGTLIRFYTFRLVGSHVHFVGFQRQWRRSSRHAWEVTEVWKLDDPDSSNRDQPRLPSKIRDQAVDSFARAICFVDQ